MSDMAFRALGKPCPLCGEHQLTPAMQTRHEQMDHEKGQG